MVLSCCDQVLQIQRSIKLPSVRHCKDRRNIIIICRLGNQLTHSLLYGQVFTDHNAVRCHSASDLILIKGADHFDIFPHLFIQKLDQKLAFFFIDLL